MKISTRDIVLVRRGLIVLAILACLGATAVAMALERSARAAARHQEALAERSDLLARLSRAGDEEAAIRRAASRYRELAARGGVGPERRMDWVEALDRIGEELRIPGIQYQFSPPRRLDPDARPDRNAFMVSTMTLRLQLLHEEDLLGLLSRLAASPAALVRVRACHVERLAAGAVADAVARLQAECMIDWVTLELKA